MLTIWCLGLLAGVLLGRVHFKLVLVINSLAGDFGPGDHPTVYILISRNLIEIASIEHLADSIARYGLLEV